MTIHLTWPLVFEALGVLLCLGLAGILAYSFLALWLFAGGMKPRKSRVTITSANPYNEGEYLQLSGENAGWKVVRCSGDGPYTLLIERKNRRRDR